MIDGILDLMNYGITTASTYILAVSQLKEISETNSQVLVACLSQNIFMKL